MVGVEVMMVGVGTEAAAGTGELPALPLLPLLGCLLRRGIFVRRLNFSIHPSENDGGSKLAYSGSSFHRSWAAVLSISFVKYSPVVVLPLAAAAAVSEVGGVEDEDEDEDIEDADAILLSTHSCKCFSSCGYFGRRARIVLLLTWVLSAARRMVEIVLGLNGRPYFASNQVLSCFAEHW